MKRIKRHIGVHHINSWKSFLLALLIMAGGTIGITYSLHNYPNVFSTNISIEKARNIGPAEPIIIDFSQPIIDRRYDKQISISPSVEFDINWQNSYRRMIITPKSFWKPESGYSVFLPKGKNAMFVNVNSARFDFSTIDFPKVTGINPQNGAKDVTLDIEDPIVVDFDKSTAGFFIKFTVDPASSLSYQNNTGKTEFKLLPQDQIQEGQDYKIKVYAKYINDSDDNYKLISESAFSTLPPAPTEWAKDYIVRIEQAKKYTRAKITTGKYIDVNLEAQVLSIFQDGKLIDSYMVSSGKSGMPTPTGQYTIHNKAPRVWSAKYGLYMPWWMAVASDGSFGIHELPEWPGGYKEGAAHLGTPVSHGCVRLGVGPAKTVYDWTEVGTPVVIY